MTLATPATKARRRKIVAVCTCPACLVGYYTSPQGVFFCRETRDFAAYAGGSPLSFHKFETAATEALGVYRIDQAKAEAIELAAAEADLAHDVAQASTDADVVVAIDLDTHRLNSTMQPMPPYIYYSRHAHGFTWVGCPDAFPSYTAAENARDGRL